MAESHREEIAKLESLYASNPGGRVFVHLAEALRKAGELERARSILTEGLARHPDSASGFVVLGRVMADLEAPDEADAAFRQVLALDGGNLVALRGLGDIARFRGRRQEAIGHYRDLLNRSPSNDEVRSLVALLEADQAAKESAADDQPAGEDDDRHGGLEALTGEAGSAPGSAEVAAAGGADATPDDLAAPASGEPDGFTPAAADPPDLPDLSEFAGEESAPELEITSFEDALAYRADSPDPDAHDVAPAAGGLDDVAPHRAADTTAASATSGYGGQIGRAMDDEDADSPGDDASDDQAEFAVVDSTLLTDGSDGSDQGEAPVDAGAEPSADGILDEASALDIDWESLENAGADAADDGPEEALLELLVTGDSPRDAGEPAVEIPGAWAPAGDVDAESEADADADAGIEAGMAGFGTTDAHTDQDDMGGGAVDREVAGSPADERLEPEYIEGADSGTPHDASGPPDDRPIPSLTTADAEPGSAPDGAGPDETADAPFQEFVASEPDAAPEQGGPDRVEGFEAGGFGGALGGPATPGFGLQTETMADLYMSQGFHDRAAQVYRTLLQQRPGDETLAAKLREAESAGRTGRGRAAENVFEEDEAGEAWLRGSAWTGPAEAEAAAGEDATPYTWTRPDEEPVEPAGPPIGTYLQVLIGWRPATDPGGVDAAEAPEGGPHAAAGGEPETGGTAAAAESAAMPWEEPREEPPADPEAPVAEVAGSGGAEDAPWLAYTNDGTVGDGDGVAVAGGAQEAEPGASPTPGAGGTEASGARGRVDDVQAAFDEWFGAPERAAGPAEGAGTGDAEVRGEPETREPVAAEPASAGTATAAAEQDAAEQAEEDEDLEMFRSWLQSLKR